MYIANPLAALGGMSSMFSTHPPMEERIARLEAMAATAGAGGGSSRGQSQHAPLGPTMSPNGPWGGQPEAPRRGPWG